MSEDKPSTAVAVRPERQLVADVVPIFDSARFEHYGRIAAVMAQSTLVPATLRAGSRDEAIANCIQVVEFADRAGYSPFAVAQCASVLHGKLMFEGKLVDAMLQTKLGIELRCYFTGERGKDDRRVYVTDAELTEEQYDALSPGKYPFGIRMIDGSIAEWKTFEKSGAINKAWTGQQSEMQLGYKGKRTWSRAYRPSVMLGVVTDDEVQDFEDRRLEPVAALTSGFGGEKPPRSPRTAKTPPTPNAAAEPDEPSHASQEAASDREFEEAEFEDVGERPTGTDSAPPADAGQDTSASASPAPDASQDQAASGQPTASETTSGGAPDTSQAEPDDEAEEKTTAAPGEVYLMAGDAFNAEGKRPTYKDGVRFSSVGEKAAGKLTIHDFHAPIIEEVVEDAGDFPGDRPPTADATDPFDIALGKIADAPSYFAGKQALKTLGATEAYAEATLERKAGVRLAIWKRYVDLCEAKVENGEVWADFTLMRMFLEFGATSPAHIDELWAKFWRHDAYKKASDADKRAITNLMVARKAEMKEAG